LLHIVAVWTDADYRIATAIHNAIESAGGDAAGVVGRVVELQLVDRRCGKLLVFRKRLTTRHFRVTRIGPYQVLTRA